VTRPATGKDSGFVHFDAIGLNGGVPSAAAARDYVTPPPRIFTRSHAAVPEIDSASWRLVIGGLVGRPLELSLIELRTRFPVRDVTAALVCAGLRRREFLRLGSLNGELPWGGEPVANIRWRGVSLKDVLAVADVAPDGRHVVMTGLDCVERQGAHFGFGGSIPMEKAQDQDALLAFELDGKPLPPEHGFPVRAFVPGWIGARSVKWLGRIDLSAQPSNNYFRTSAYRMQRSANPDAPLDVTAGDALEEIFLNSAIVTPDMATPLRAGQVDVAGWAIGPRAEAPSRVEVSSDGGMTWIDAVLQPAADRWSWRLWRRSIMLAPGSHELVVRAWDRAGQTQPQSIEETWNVKGYVNNAWHRVTVAVDE
jgi:sulfite oxidase